MESGFCYAKIFRTADDTLAYASSFPILDEVVKELDSALQALGTLEYEIDDFDFHADVPDHLLKHRAEAIRYISQVQTQVEERIAIHEEERVPDEYDPWMDDNLTEDGCLSKS
jgi:hypothetical protein